MKIKYLLFLCIILLAIAMTSAYPPNLTEILSNKYPDYQFSLNNTDLTISKDSTFVKPSLLSSFKYLFFKVPSLMP